MKTGAIKIKRRFLVSQPQRPKLHGREKPPFRDSKLVYLPRFISQIICAPEICRLVHCYEPLKQNRQIPMVLAFQNHYQ
jgi:hypothetical protein